MAIENKPLNIAAALAVALVAGAAASGIASAQNTLGKLANNASIFIDGKTFEIRAGTARGDVTAPMRALGARELGGGAIVFRSGDKLYIVGGGGDQSALLPPEGPVHIEYQVPKNPDLKEVYERITQRRSLEKVRELLSPFRLPEDLYIKTVECNGVPNAYFFRENDLPTIRFCYEYLQQVWQNLPQETTMEGITPEEALVGQLMFTTLHEFGHAAFDIYNVPIFGRQEDAADQFATYIMLQFGGEKAHRLLRGAAYAYLGLIDKIKAKPKADVTVPLAAFSSDHEAPEQRFYNLACIAYGSDPKIFAAVVNKDYLPENRAKVCKYEYSNLRYAVHRLITPHVDMRKVQEVIASFQLEGNARAPGQ
jgi:putative metallopeptidase DUF4344